MSDMLRRAPGPFFALGFLALVVVCLSLARDYAVPIAVAVLIWFLINAVANGLRRGSAIGRLMPDWFAKLISVGVLFGAIVLSARVIAGNVAQLSEGVTGEEAVLVRELEALAASVGLEAQFRIEPLIERLGVDTLLGWTLSTAQGLITDISLVFLYVLFLMVDQRYYETKMRALFPDPDRREALEATLKHMATEIRHYIWLMSLISLGVAMMTYFVSSGVGLRGPGFWAFLAFALNFIPTIGSITAVVLPALYGLLTLDDPLLLAVLIGALSATQFVAGEIILPRLMGDRLNLATFVILLMLVIWGAMWGPAGMFLAIPITVILVLILGRFDTTRPIAIALSKDGRVPRI